MIDSNHPKCGTACCGHTVVILTAVIESCHPKRGTTACKPPTQCGMLVTCRHPKCGTTWSTYNYNITKAVAVVTLHRIKSPPKAWCDFKQPAPIIKH